MEEIIEILKIIFLILASILVLYMRFAFTKFYLDATKDL